ATLSAQSGGRFLLGLGASTPQLTEGLHDVSFTAPVAQLRRIVTQVRALLRGERIPLERVTAARALKLNLPSGPDVPIFLAALHRRGSRSRRVAARGADRLRNAGAGARETGALARRRRRPARLAAAAAADGGGDRVDARCVPADAGRG